MAEPIISEILERMFTAQTAITGARDFMPQKNGLVFRVTSRGPNGSKNGASHIMITGDGRETYDVGFFKFDSFHESIRRIDTIRQVPCDRLIAAVQHGIGS